jgi:hypothetical protein
MKRHLLFALATLRLLPGCLIALLAFDAGSWAIVTAAVVALVINSEIIAIHCLMDSPPVDAPSIFALPKKPSRWQRWSGTDGIPAFSESRYKQKMAAPTDGLFDGKKTSAQAAGFAAPAFLALAATFLRLI